MLKRIYIDNYRCFVNFELRLNQQQLILGLNGSGKSTLLDVLRAIRNLCIGDCAPDVLFPSTTHTRWQTLSQQSFELDVELDGIPYQYKLQLESWGAPLRTRIRHEIVMSDQRPVFEFIDGEVHLFNDQFQQKVKYPFDWFRSALATIQRRSENSRLMRFKDWVSSLHCLQIDPHRVSGSTDLEQSRPADDLSNFAAWYRHLSQERFDSAAALQNTLGKIIPGFESLDLRSAGGAVRTLSARFGSSEDRERVGYAVGFDELSEGQRILVCLYAILEFLVEGSSCLFLDEPENFIALPEIQPWLMELQDRITDRGGQVILISHHPEMIDYLAADIGLVFERIGSGPVRTRPYAASAGDALSPSERIARGWFE